MFVDASAMVAILAGEPGNVSLAQAIRSAEAPITSAIAVFETATALTRKKAIPIEGAEREVYGFLKLAGIRIVALGDAEALGALGAYARFGKGRGHPAQLNMGDCFAYAAATTHGLPLLFVGNDFPQTDIRPAMP